MGHGLSVLAPGEVLAVCPVRKQPDFHWRDELPMALQDMAIAPAAFEIFEDHDALADRVSGRDVDNEPCYCAFRYVRTALRSDDDELFFETPVYAETQTSWRLRDSRWLTLRKIFQDFDLGSVQSRLSITDTMPR